MQYDPQQFQEEFTKMNTEDWLLVKTDSHVYIQHIQTINCVALSVIFVGMALQVAQAKMQKEWYWI